MGKVEYEKWMDILTSDLEEELETEDINIYGPLSENYWSAKKRILVCGLESYDKADYNRKIDMDYIKNNWMKNQTILNSFTFSAALLNRLLNNELEINIQYLRDLYKNEDELLKINNQISYMNVRLTNNDQRRPDYGYIWGEVRTTHKYLKEQIKQLEPEIIIIGGKYTTEMFNFILGEKEYVPYLESKTINNYKCFSTYHFSGQGIHEPYYEYMVKK